MKYQVRLSRRAERDLDRLDKPTQKRILLKPEQLLRSASLGLVERGGRVAEVARGSVADHQVVEDTKIVFVVMIERRAKSTSVSETLRAIATAANHMVHMQFGPRFQFLSG